MKLLERKFVKEGLVRSKLDHYLKKDLKRAGYVGVKIQKTPVMTRIAIKVERPGLIIGRKGANIQALTRKIEKDFGFENAQIKVEEVPVPELDAAVMARRIASSLERGINFRRVLHWNLERIIGAGALGAEIVVSGKLVGKGGKSRCERVNSGYMKKAGESAKLVEISRTQAIKKAGIIGVTVKIVPPHVVFPDKVDVRKALEPEKPAEPEKAEQVEGEVAVKAEDTVKVEPAVKAKDAVEKVKGGDAVGDTKAEGSKGTGPGGEAGKAPAA